MFRHNYVFCQRERTIGFSQPMGSVENSHFRIFEKIDRASLSKFNKLVAENKDWYKNIRVPDTRTDH